MTMRDNEYFRVVHVERGHVEGFAILQGSIRNTSLHLKRIAVRTPNSGFGRALLDHEILPRIPA